MRKAATIEINSFEEFKTAPTTEEARAELERKLTLIIYADPLELFWPDHNGQWHLRRPEQLPYSIKVAVKAIHRNKEGGIYYELFDKYEAMEALCRLKGWSKGRWGSRRHRKK